MIRSVLVAVVAFPAAVMAQEIVKPAALDAQSAVVAFGEQPPDEGSPFFMDRERARLSVTQEGIARTKADEVSEFPKTKSTDGSAVTMFGKFFTDMFSSVRIKVKQHSETSQKIKLDPETFSPSDRKDVDVNYVISNNTGKIMRIDYPSSQRVEILTKETTTDAKGNVIDGKVIDKWSDDQAFSPREGIVFINPKERIEYSEKMSTRDMKSGQMYSIEGSVPNNPQFTHRELVTPQ